jgi:hypothetical protein
MMGRDQPDLSLDLEDDSLISKVQMCLKLRASALTALSLRADAITLEHIRTLGDVFTNLFVRKVPGRFPIDLTKFQSEIMRQAPGNDGGSGGASAAGGARARNSSFSGSSSPSLGSSSASAAAIDDLADFKDAGDAKGGSVGAAVGVGSLLPAPVIVQPNLNCIVIEIDRIGLKDAGNYIDGRITVSVAGAVRETCKRRTCVGSAV